MLKQELGILILRVVLGLIFAIHGFVKFQNGIGETVGVFESNDLPGILAYGVAVLELVGGILLIIGFATRVIAALFVLLMAGAILTVKLASGFLNGYEFNLALMAMALFLTMVESKLFAVEIVS